MFGVSGCGLALLVGDSVLASALAVPRNAVLLTGIMMCMPLPILALKTGLSLTLSDPEKSAQKK